MKSFPTTARAATPRVSVPGAELLVIELGSGPTLVTLHGGCGFDHRYLRPWLDPLAQRCRLVYFDQRGQGESSAPANWEEVEHSTYVADLEALRDRLGIERMFLFGHSYGGHIALEYAIEHPERLAGLVLCSTGAAMLGGAVIVNNADSRGSAAQAAAVVRALSAPLKSDGEFEAVIREILPLYFHEPQLAERTGLFDGGSFSVDAFNRAYHHCIQHYDVTGRLGQIRAPALVLSGDDDWVTPLHGSADVLHAGIADSRLVVFDDCGHFPFVEASERFQSVVLDWITAISSRQPMEAF